MTKNTNSVERFIVSKIDEIADGEIQWVKDYDIIHCCDCGLAHKIRIGMGYLKGKPTPWYKLWRKDAITKRYRLSERIYLDVEKRVKRK